VHTVIGPAHDNTRGKASSGISAMALKPQPPNPAVRGVQRNLQLKTQHQDLADDAEKRLGKQFIARSSPSTAPPHEQVKLNMTASAGGGPLPGLASVSKQSRQRKYS
jgi:hypothetical protein